MKKAISLILTICLLSGTVAFSAAAEKKSVTPAIIISGYASSAMYSDFGEKDQEQVWVFNVGDAVTQSISDTPQLLAALFKVFTGEPEAFGTQIAKAGKKILTNLFCNSDGSSACDIETWPNEPEMNSYTNLMKVNKKEVIEKDLSAYAAQQVGGDNVFVFHYDFRMGGYDIANELKVFVDKVLDYTGAQKVSLFGLSYGGFIVGTYLSLFGDEGKVDNAVMNVPALGGTSFARRFFEGQVDLSMFELATLAETLLGSETNFAGFFGAGKVPVLNKMIQGFLLEVQQLPVYFTSLWDLMTPEDYEVMKAKYLNSEDSAELIRKSDIIHHQVMKNYSETFNRLQQNGVDISIICNYGMHTAFGGDELNDMLLDAKRTSGANCTKIGERFEDGYKCSGTACSDKSHNHLSPSMEIDASSAYLPEDTWFVDGQCHGCYAQDPYTLALVEELMFSQNETDIYTFSAYPQFNTSKCAHYSVDAAFDSSLPGYLGKDDTALIITNTSSKYIFITGVKFSGAELSVKLPAFTAIAPGKTLRLKLSGNIPKVTAAHATVSISCLKQTLGKMSSTREFDIQINGK